MTNYDYDDWLSNDFDEADLDWAEYNSPYFDDDDELPDAYYEQWNPAVNPPVWYQCRACNGMGSDPYSVPCETCDGTGVRYRLAYRLRAAWGKITFHFRHMKRVRRCQVCGRVYVATDDFCPDPACPSSFPF